MVALPTELPEHGFRSACMTQAGELEEPTMATGRIRPAESTGRILSDGMPIRTHDGGSIVAADRE